MASENLMSVTSRSDALRTLILDGLDDDQAENVVAVDISSRSSVADHVVIATGRSRRHVGAMADTLRRSLKDGGFSSVPIEGRDACDWVLLDAGDVVVHIFRHEVRSYYALDDLWTAAANDDSVRDDATRDHDSAHRDDDGATP